MSTIFINYRRDDAQGAAFSLQNHLSREFGRRRVFIDIHGLSAGTEFDLELDRQIEACGAMVVMIGPYWLKTTETGERRIDDPRDFVRIEIAKALHMRKPILPVIVGDAQMPTAEELPDEIRDLHRFNGRPLRFERFSADADEITQALQQMVRRARPAWSWLGGAAAAGVAIGLISGALLGQVLPGLLGLGGQTQLDTLEATVQQLRSDKLEFLHQLNDVNLTLQSKQDVLDANAVKLTDLDRRLTAAKAAVGDQTEARRDAEAAVLSLRRERTALSDQNEVLLQSQTEQNARIASLEDQIARAPGAAQIAKQRRDLDTSRAEVRNLTTRLTRLEADRARLLSARNALCLGLRTIPALTLPVKLRDLMARCGN